MEYIMVFEKTNFDNPKQLEIPVGLHEYTWEYYYKQYSLVLQYIIALSIKREYRLNCMQMPIMFIFRHTVELLLKKKLADVGKTIRESHDLKELVVDLGDSALLDFVNKAHVLRPNGQGDCFKYTSDKDGTKHFNSEILDVLPCISSFMSISGMNTNGLDLNMLDVNSKKLKHEWSFYTVDTRTLGHIKTQYDFLISSILSSIKNGELKIEQVYLPLLFLIRHSLEVGFKDNISEVLDRLTNSQKKKYSEKHSLETLLNIVIQFVEEAQKNFTSIDGTIQKEIDYYRPMTEQLMKKMHELDNRSLSFRFPVDENGLFINIPFSQNVLSDAVAAYQTADPFISLSISVLKYEGYLK
jgi:hypothetical protein